MFGSGNDASPFGELMGSKSSMRIHLDHHFKTKVYTSSSPLSGHVEIGTTKDVHFDRLQVLLLGNSKTRLDNTHAPHTTSYTFLKLEMPVSASSYPSPRIFQAGQSYIIPFNFVIPKHLTINACNHMVDSEAVHENHLCLPPSMGSWGGRDDLSPDMARIEYSVIARVLRSVDDDGKRAKVLETSHPIRVLPAYSEQAPLDIGPHDRLYKMSRSKNLRKSLLSGKTGKFTISARQPGAVMLGADGTLTSGTKAQLDLTFEPTSAHNHPPVVSSISAKLMSMTYFSSGAINGLPNMGDWLRGFGADSRGAYPNTVSLAHTPVEKVTWRQQIRSQARRDSGYGSEAGSEAENSYDAQRKARREVPSLSPIYHTASLQVPIDLPSHKKLFIPTFHSCISSRAYVLWLTVALAPAAGAAPNANLTLMLPLQIGVEAAHNNLAELPPTFAAAVEEAEAEAVDAYLRPRSLRNSVPETAVRWQEDQHREQEHVLPVYADLMGGRTTVSS